jgi:hypothetical protein
MKYLYKFWVGETTRKSDIKFHLEETRFEDVGWIQVAHNTV